MILCCTNLNTIAFTGARSHAGRKVCSIHIARVRCTTVDAITKHLVVVGALWLDIDIVAVVGACDRADVHSAGGKG